MEAIERVLLSNDLITILFFIAFLFVFLMKLYKPNYLVGYTVSFFKKGFIEKQLTDGATVFSVFYILLFCFSIVIVSVTLFVLFSPLYYEFNIEGLLVLLLGSFGYFFSKYLFSQLLLVVFNLKNELGYLFYAKNAYFYTTCLLFFPVLIINQYFVENNCFLLLFIALLLIFRLFLIFKNNKKVIFNNMFYFILYFCALELAPLLLLIKTKN